MLIGLPEQRVDPRLGKARCRSQNEAPRPAGRQALLGEDEDVGIHLVELIEDDEVRVHAGDLAAAVRATQEDEALAQVLEALAVGALAPRGFRLEAATQVGAVLDEGVEAGLGEIVHLVLGGHAEEHVAPSRVAGVRRPQREGDEGRSRPDLGRLLQHHQRAGVAHHVGEVRERQRGPFADREVRHHPGERVMRVAAALLLPDFP